MNWKWMTGALLSGALFGFGLTVSGMTDANRVQGFLDLFGEWDPTLMFVLGGAVLTTFLLFPLVKRREKPVLDTCFHLPRDRKADRQLVIGAAIFGIGWGLAGYCPGPALAGLGVLSTESLWFVPAMLAGMTLHRLFESRK